MRIFSAIVVFASVLASMAAGAQEPEAAVRFEAVDVYIDSAARPLAAYQFEFAAETGEIKIVGVEGGEHEAFKQPPYYDPAALSNDRIIIAAFNTGRNLPSGKTRVARIHLQVTGAVEPEYVIILGAAATSDGEEIAARGTIAQGEGE